MGGCVFVALGGEVSGTWRGYENGKDSWGKCNVLYLTQGPPTCGSVLRHQDLDGAHSTKKTT